MEILSDLSRFVHILFGAVGLVAFWVPVFTRKGATNHVRFGNIFVRCAYVVLAAAALALLARVAILMSRQIGPQQNPDIWAFIVFLAYLTFVTFVTVRHGMCVLTQKQQPRALAGSLNTGLAVASIAASGLVILYAIGMSPRMWIVLVALSPIGIASGIGILRYTRGNVASKRAWMYEHLGAMFGAGIAFHTAFAVFGVNAVISMDIGGALAVIPWIAPAAIGIPATVLWTRHYQKKFGEL